MLTYFKNSEYLLITVPARKELWTNFDSYYGHFRRYDLAMVRDFMEELNYKVIENRYFFHSLYYLIRISNFLRKNRELECVPPKGLEKSLQALIGNAIYLEKFFIPGSFVGSSIICLARKK
jgi:hypothetical protein